MSNYNYRYNDPIDDWDEGNSFRDNFSQPAATGNGGPASGGFDDFDSFVRNPGNDNPFDDGALLGGHSASGSKSNPKGQNNGYVPDNGESDDAARDFVEYEQKQQMNMMRDQDEQLDQVVVTLGNLKDIAAIMNQELDDQSELINDLDLGVENVNSKLGGGMKKLQQFINDNADTRQQWTICCLIIILIVLLLIVILA